MISLAFGLIRSHKAGLAGAFVAIMFGSAILTACGILLDSSARGGFPPERYAAASVVVGAPQSLLVPQAGSQPYSERVPVPARWAAELARVPGVKTAVGDVSVPIGLISGSGRVLAGTGGKPVLAHGWSSAVLGPFTISAGTAPRRPGEVVLDTALAAQAGVRPGDSVEVLFGGVPSRFRVAGLATPPPGGLPRQSAVFLTDGQAMRAYGRPDEVDAVGVIADPGVRAGALASRIDRALPGAVTYTGGNRAEAEFIGIGQGRSFLLQVAGSLGGAMVLTVLFVVIAALGLAIQQRRSELALLRAIAATPGQVYQLIAIEVLIVATVAAAAGALPGLAVSSLMRAAFVSAGMIPAGFALYAGPLPVIASVAVCVVVAGAAALIAARRAARMTVAGAIAEAADRPARAGRPRLVTGYLLVAAGVGVAVAVPLLAPGQLDAIQGSVSGAAIILLIAVALLGPHWLPAVVRLSGPVSFRPRAAAGFLAAASMHARSRRISLAAIPLVMAVALAAVEIFATTTLVAAARQQARAGLTASYVVTGSGPGLSPRIAAAVRGVAGVSAVTPVARTQVLASFRSAGSPDVEPFSAQGITPAGLHDTMRLDVSAGSMAALRGDTVALSRSAAATLGAGVGQMVRLYLGDGTAVAPRVVAIYGNGLGFGDVTLPNATVIDHTTSRLDANILVGTAPGASVAAVGRALAASLARYPGVTVADRGAFTAAQASALAGQSDTSLTLDGILLAYIMIAVVNSLVVATAARAREFAVLRLIGVTRGQVRAMMRHETGVIVVAAVVIGSLIAVPPLVSVSAGMTGNLLPDVPPLEYLSIVAAVTALGWGSIMIPARLALRSRPSSALDGRL
jgi:putative ABC transport system permease protein